MPFEIRTNHCILITIQTMMLHVDVFFFFLIVSCQHLKQKQNWLTSALWNYAKTCIKQNQQTGWISLSDSRWRLWKSSDKREEMQSKLLSSQFPSEIYSYKPPPQYLYFSSYKQWACSACTIFSLFASVHFSPCLQEINLWTFSLAETAVELLFWRKTPDHELRGFETQRKQAWWRDKAMLHLVRLTDTLRMQWHETQR